MVLQAKVLDLGEPKAILALAPSPPMIDDIERTILSLKEVCMHLSLYVLDYVSTSAVHFHYVSHEAKCALVTRLCVSVYVNNIVGTSWHELITRAVCLSLATFPH